MTRSTKRSTNRSAMERVFTNQIPKTGAELKALMKEPADPALTVPRSGVIGLRRWAVQRRSEDIHEYEFWCGYITAIDEILAREAS